MTTIPHRRTYSGDPSESNDCVVIALAVATQKPYSSIRTKLAELGRHNKVGTYDDVLKEALEFYGFHLNLNLYNFTVKQLIEKCKKGTFFCRNDGHAFAIIDGIVYDCLTPNNRKRVKRVYELLT